MTTPTTSKTPAKSARSATKPDNSAVEVKETETVETPNVETSDVKTEDVKPTDDGPRIPQILQENNILAGICQKYIEIYDEISEYNKSVLGEKTSEWTASKVLAESRKLAHPEDANVKPNEDVKRAVEEFERLATELSKARKNVIDETSKALGISLSSVADSRDPEKEAPLKEKRKIAITIADQLDMIAGMTSDAEAKKAVVSFLAKNEMPAVGRNQTRAYAPDGSGTSTPKYRVTIAVFNSDGEQLLEEKGFTKTALALTKPVFGYERGKSIKSETFRSVWENAGNSADEPYKVSPVEFEDNNLKFVIRKSE